MPIYYPDILQQATPAQPFYYGDRDVMLYALGVGLGGADPLDPKELAFTYEKNLKVVPTAVTVLADQVVRKAKAQVPDGVRFSTWDMLKVLHGEQKVELHRPLPADGHFNVESKVVGAFDKGADKGGLVVQKTFWRDAAGEKVATLTTTLFARGDGGFGGPTEGAPVPHQRPDRAADLSLELPTRADQALLYRLNGDRNPLHVDPDVARQAGFHAPILHGLCTYGLTCRAVLQGMLDYDAESILSHEVRFTSPVYPGETITVDMWRDGKVISFEARVEARDTYVIRNGKTVLR